MIDTDRIDELRDEIGAEDLAEVVGMFVAEMRDELSALEHRSSDDMAAGLHALKGAAANLGLSELADLCRQGEAALRDGTELAGLPARLRGCFDASARALAQAV